jgi:hypothetical protein
MSFTLEHDGRVFCKSMLICATHNNLHFTGEGGTYDTTYSLTLDL